MASALTNWTGVGESFLKADPKWDAKAQIVGQIYTDESMTALNMVPTVYNFDSIGYRPDLVSAEEASMWSSLFDPKFKGKTGLNVDPLIAFGQAVLAMNELGLLEVANPGNPDAAAIEEARTTSVNELTDTSRPGKTVASTNGRTNEVSLAQTEKQFFFNICFFKLGKCDSFEFFLFSNIVYFRFIH